MDPALKKRALRLLTYGLYVVTARHGDSCTAGTITWLSQCSFEPPLVMVGIQRKSSLHKVVAASHAFAVNVPGKNQKKLATHFFKTAEHSGNKLGGYEIEPGATGAPVLADVPAWFECRVVEEIRRGDHTIFIGEVVAAGVRRDEEPLTLRDTGFSYGG
jgi:flavin reductase (DIM6/NTAB) family NADH-FMN oxidoreductase RutF